MNCIVVDDEPIARQGIAKYVTKTPFLQLVGQCSNAFEAIDLLHKTPIDIVFLDINMPELTGIEMVESLQKIPMIIFVTANPNHALKGFELNAIDYLLKPISYAKFLKASQKAHEIYQLKQAKQNNENQTIFIKVEKDLIQLQINDIAYIEALKDYIHIVTQEQQYITYLTLAKMKESLPNDFIQVHRSFIVNKTMVDKIYATTIYILNKQIPIGRTYKEQALAEITHGKIVKK